MTSRKDMICIGIYAAVLVLVASLGTAAAASPPLSPQEQLGKLLFFDKNLSTPVGQACAACHAPNVGWTGPDQRVNATGAVYPGAVRTRFGNRKPPTSAYAGDSPILHTDGTGAWVGGMFWDGRATGTTLGDPLAEQAQGPFLNPLEQNNASAQVVVDKVKASAYKDLYQQVCQGCNDDITCSYACIARAIAAYERSGEVSAFTSKYDYYLQGKAHLTPTEKWGLQLFNGKGKCSACHISEKGPSGEPPLFTDFTYDNLGVPRNPLNPFYREPDWNPLGKDWVDEGLGGFLKSKYPDNPEIYEPELGKMKVPTLRNVDKRPYPWFMKAYSHNGYFKSLTRIVHFYNTRDVLPPCTDCRGIPGYNCWPKPEEPLNVNRTEMGNLGLTPWEEYAIVAFLRTLSDGYDPRCQR